MTRNLMELMGAKHSSTNNAPASAPAAAPTAAPAGSDKPPLAAGKSTKVMSAIGATSEMVGDVTGDAAVALKKISSEINKDLSKLPDAIEKRQKFYFMEKDARCIYGLQDWSTTEWQRRLDDTGEAGLTFVKDFLDVVVLGGDSDESKVATQIKQKLSQLLPISDWKLVVAFQNHALNLQDDGKPKDYYLEDGLLNQFIFEREFPLGVEERLCHESGDFVVANSGLHEVRHQRNTIISTIVYAFMLFVLIAAIVFLSGYMSRTGPPDIWTLNATLQDTSDPLMRRHIDTRTRVRSTVASCLQSFSFSLTVNACLDKFGKVDPSSSTVLVGMTLGGTFGFVLDNAIGSDEGFREYLWAPTSGMAYALGSLYSARYVRFCMAIIFDMFFTVILFKHMYTRLVRFAGFSASGNEWIANGFVSFLLGVLTFQVYANMTRFQWAYPSGAEDVYNQWVSGSTMVLAIAIMAMLYLTTETRTRVGEKGINDPPVKLAIVFFAFCALWGMNVYNVLDPSIAPAAPTSGSNWTKPDPFNMNLPLSQVCATTAYWKHGLVFFIIICFSCLNFVIFVTSKQSFSGLRHLVRGPPPPARPTKGDFLLGKLALFFIFFCVCALILLFFAVVPLYSHGTGAPRDEAAYQEACAPDFRRLGIIS